MTTVFWSSGLPAPAPEPLLLPRPREPSRPPPSFLSSFKSMVACARRALSSTPGPSSHAPPSRSALSSPASPPRLPPAIRSSAPALPVEEQGVRARPRPLLRAPGSCSRWAMPRSISAAASEVVSSAPPLWLQSRGTGTGLGQKSSPGNLGVIVTLRRIPARPAPTRMPALRRPAAAPRSIGCSAPGHRTCARFQRHHNSGSLGCEVPGSAAHDSLIQASADVPFGCCLLQGAMHSETPTDFTRRSIHRTVPAREHTEYDHITRTKFPRKDQTYIELK